MATRTTSSVAPQIEALRVTSFLAVALKTRRGTLGTITTSRFDERNPFTADDMALLEDLADRAALAIENAQLHEAERQARARAEEADRRKDEFLAMLGHELRNPLAPIRRAVEILRELAGRQDARPSAATSSRDRWRTWPGWSTTCSTSSRINRGKIELRRAPSISAAVASALEASRPLLSSERHQMTVELPARAGARRR